MIPVTTLGIGQGRITFIKNNSLMLKIDSLLKTLSLQVTHRWYWYGTVPKQNQDLLFNASNFIPFALITVKVQRKTVFLLGYVVKWCFSTGTIQFFVWIGRYRYLYASTLVNITIRE